MPGGSRGRRGTRSRTQAGPGAGPRAGGAGCLAGPASCVDGRAAQARDASSGRACTASLGAVASGAGAVRYLVVPLGDFQIPSLAPSSFPRRSAGAVKGGGGLLCGAKCFQFFSLRCCSLRGQRRRCPAAGAGATALQVAACAPQALRAALLPRAFWRASGWARDERAEENAPCFSPRFPGRGLEACCWAWRSVPG